MTIFLVIIGVMAAIGLLFGFVLAFANKKFAVEMNPLIHVVEDILPKGQCGACGFPGCQAYAEAVVLDKDVAPNLCIPGKKAIADQVAKLTGKTAEDVEPRYAFVKCWQAPVGNSKYVYDGIDNCWAAALLQNGPKECEYGCMGLGSCVDACVFDALHIGEDGLPKVNKNNCTGCGKCAEACPKSVISMIPADAHVAVHCNSKKKGAEVRKVCKIGCIACGACVKNCPYDAITMVDNLAVVNSAICVEKCSDPVCMEKCPTKVLQSYLIDTDAVLKKAINQ